MINIQMHHIIPSKLIQVMIDIQMPHIILSKLIKIKIHIQMHHIVLIKLIKIMTHIQMHHILPYNQKFQIIQKNKKKKTLISIQMHHTILDKLLLEIVQFLIRREMLAIQVNKQKILKAINKNLIINEYFIQNYYNIYNK